MASLNTIKVNKDHISENILEQISENLYDDLYLIFDMECSLTLSRETKDRIMFEIITSKLDPVVLKKPDFPKFYAVLKQNIMSNMEYLRHVKRTGLLPPLYKLEMITNLVLDQLDHEALHFIEEEELDTETLSQYDDVISLYGDVPPIDDPYGRELRIQLHLIKNSKLQFADPEKKAELLEELLLQNEESEYREFFIVDALHRAMNLDDEDLEL
ncbi:hypothetical protein WDW89_08705 [Deltaproteobacteria bacterium TL4]